LSKFAHNNKQKPPLGGGGFLWTHLLFCLFTD